MLTLSEQLLLLGLNDDKGSVVFSASTALPYGLAGAVLLELFLLNKIDLKQSKIKVVNSAKTDNDILNDVLKLIDTSSKRRDTKYWVSTIHRKVPKIQERLAEQLVEKRILSREEHSFMWLIKYNRYPSDNDKPEQDIRARVKEIVLKRAHPDETELALISLIKACELTNEVFEKSERKKANQRIKQLSEKQPVGKVISAITEEIMAAIMVVIIASTVTTTVT